MVSATAAGEVSYPRRPGGSQAIVDRVVSAEREEPLRLLVATGRCDHPRAETLSELQREQRNAARPKGQHGLPRAQAAAARQRVPGRDGCAGEACRLLEREMIGEVHERVLVENRVLGQHPVE